MAVVVDNGIWLVQFMISALNDYMLMDFYIIGILICVRAIIQYLNIKRGWRLLSGSAQERLLFFY